LAAGYEQAFDELSRILPSLVVAHAEELRDVAKVRTYLRSAVVSKQATHHELITDLVAQACGIPFLLC
jgi:hypothetical protein